MINMDDKTKVYVFAKKEVFTIFLIMVVASFASFLLGVKIGGEFAMRDAGITSKMQQAMKERPEMDFKSTEEESVDNIVETQTEQPKNKKPDDAYRDEIQKKIEEEFKMENDKFNESSSKKTMPETTSVAARPQEVIAASTPSMPETEKVKKNEWTGKHTIQLRAYKSKDDAEEFAKTVTVRGYDPIIYETEVDSKGKWFRVSVGVFDSVSEAKDFVLKNQSFFTGSDYFFAKFE